MSIYKELLRRGGQVAAPTDVCEQCKNYSPKFYLLYKQEMKNIVSALPNATMYKHWTVFDAVKLQPYVIKKIKNNAHMWHFHVCYNAVYE